MALIGVSDVSISKNLSNELGFVIHRIYFQVFMLIDWINNHDNAFFMDIFVL